MLDFLEVVLTLSHLLGLGEGEITTEYPLFAISVAEDYLRVRVFLLNKVVRFNVAHTDLPHHLLSLIIKCH
jgi:hypothetical protein